MYYILEYGKKVFIMENSMILASLIFMLFMLSWAFAFLALYFIPVIVAYSRKHNHILAIAILTLFLGWSFFGWLAALLWSLNSDIKKEDDD